MAVPFYTKQFYIDYIKLMTTGASKLRSDLTDEQIGLYVDAALVELQRYMDEPVLISVPFAKIIDLKDFDYNYILHVYRTEGFTGDTTVGVTTSDVDPLYAQTWSVFTSGGTMYNLQNYVMNYLSYNTLLQMRNTLSTDLDWKEDKIGQKLYINAAYASIDRVTIEYVPINRRVEQVTSPYWVDMLKRLSLAMVKIALGRIRTRFKQTNTLMEQDGDKILQEGLDEYAKITDQLLVNDMLFIPKD